MNKILINSAINNDIQYRVTNNYNSEINKKSESIKGRIKLKKFKKIQLPSNLEIDKEYLDNKIGVLEIEYVNLNTFENFSHSIDNFYIKDLDDFRFEAIGNANIFYPICDYLNIDVEKYFHRTDNLAPKIKYTMQIFFLLPDEETDYYLFLENGEFEEI